MNINEKCLLKFLTNPIEISNQDKNIISNVTKCKAFAFANIYASALQNSGISKNQ